MSILNRLPEFTVKIGNGSGCLLQPGSSRYTYVLTAKHVLENEESLIIERYLLNDNKETEVQTLEIIGDPYPHKDPKKDAVIIKVEAIDGGQDLTAIRNPFQLFNECYLVGYPRSRETLVEDPDSREEIDSSFRENKISKILRIKTHGYIEAELEKNASHSEIVGQSGGGIIGINNNKYFLIGIQKQMTADDDEESFGRIDFMPVSFFEEIINQFPDDLNEIEISTNTDSGDVFFQNINGAPANLSGNIRVKEFQSLITERASNFVGRDFIFSAINELVANKDFPSGYILIKGEPGIGKTSISAELVNRYGYVHHFNIAPQNIRTPRDFLSNVCAQLIVRYGLDHSSLPPEAMQDSGFLSRLLAEAKVKTEEPVVVLIDALDEVENVGIPVNTNSLYLPPILPGGVYFIVTSREKYDDRLDVANREDIYLKDDDPKNLDDIQNYISKYIEENRLKMTPRISGWGIQEDEFVSTLTEKSQGNFMYLVYILNDIKDGKLTAANLDNINDLPKGLKSYYQRHWRVMREQDAEKFDKYYQPVICTLATVREPVTISALVEWTKLEPYKVKSVIDEWREFLNEERETDGEFLYRVYHSSFQDFLKQEVGLMVYHNIIVETALNKIPNFR